MANPAAVFGLPRPSLTYDSLVRATSGLDTFWAAQFAKRSTVSNYVMPAKFTLAVWVKWTTLNANRGIFSNWAGNNGSMLWVATDSKVKFHVNATDVDSGLTPALSTWYHIVATYDGTSRAIYINGSLAGGPTSGVTPNAVSTPLASHNYVGSGQADIAATLTDAIVVSRALGADEVAQHYTAGVRSGVRE